MSLKSFESRPNPGEAESLILLSNRIRRRTVEEVRQEGEEVTVTALTARLATGNDESPTAAAIGQLESELRK